MLLSRGLAAVTRDGDGLFLDFLTEDPAEAVRIAIHLSDARRMLAELKRFVDLLARAVPAAPANGLH
jgi:hypothetical protein